MYIPDHKIDEIRAATDIVEIVGDYVRLKKRGANHFGLCPFHNEKSPSFSVNRSMGIFKCFGCGKGGNVFQFVMEMESLEFPTAARALAKRAGVSIPEREVNDQQAGEMESLYHALRFAARFFYYQMRSTKAGQEAGRYLEKRGLTPATIKRFGLGFAPDQWDALLGEAVRNHIAPEVLERAGLVVRRREGDGYYDRFRGRVVFPIFSRAGKVQGFGGRVLTASRDIPKYINSPETRVYSKSRALYGFFQGKKAMREVEEVVLVEGYTDVITLHQAGVENAVACCGTALTPDQVKILGRIAQRILLLYDADAAGAGATLRGIDIVLSQGLSAYAIALPGGSDPDSFVRKAGGEAFKEYARKHRQDFVSFIYEAARSRGDATTPEGQAETMHAVLSAIARIPDSLRRETFMRRASEVLGAPLDKLRAALQKKTARDKRRRQWSRDERAPEAKPPAGIGAQERALLRLMLDEGKPIIKYIMRHMNVNEFTEGPSRTLAGHMLEMYKQNSFSQFNAGVSDEAVQRLVADVRMDRYEPSKHWDARNIRVPRLNENPKRAAASAMTLLKLKRADVAISEHRRAMHSSGDNGEDQERLQQEMMKLLAYRKQIESGQFLS